MNRLILKLINSEWEGHKINCVPVKLIILSLGF